MRKPLVDQKELMIDTQKLREKTVHLKKKGVYHLIRIIYSRL